MKLEDLPTTDEVRQDDWRQVFGIVEDEWSTAYNGPQPFTPEDVAEVLWWDGYSPEGGGSVSIAALFRLTDGRYATLMAGADYTGWDCQSYMTWSKQFDTKAEALTQGLDKYVREEYADALKEIQ